MGTQVKLNDPVGVLGSLLLRQRGKFPQLSVGVFSATTLWSLLSKTFADFYGRDGNDADIRQALWSFRCVMTPQYDEETPDGAKQSERRISVLESILLGMPRRIVRI